MGIWHPGLSSNYGDRAIQQSTVDLVLQRWPDARIIQYDNDLVAAAAAYPDPRISFEPLGPLGFPPMGRRLADLDVLLWGGGSLIQQSSMLHFPQHLLPALAASRRGVKVVCFGTGVEPMRSGLLRALVRKAFGSIFDHAFVRGPLSSQLLASYGVATEIPYAVDQAAGLEASDERDTTPLFSGLIGPDWDGPTVSVSVKRSFLYRGGVLPVAFDPPSRARAARRRQREAFDRSFGELVRYLVDEVGARVLMVPMFLSQGDVEACASVAELADRPEAVRVITQPPPPRQLKGLLSRMDAHVGVRLHSCILASSAGVPTLGVEYMTKHRDYFTMLGMTDRLISEGEVTAERLIAGFDRLWEDRSTLHDQLVSTTRELVSDLGRTVDTIFDQMEREDWS